MSRLTPPTVFAPGGALDRRRLLAGAGGALLSSAAPAAEGPAAMRAVRCADFLDGIGINTHVSYAATQYDDVAEVIAAMRYIGVRHARDVAVNSRQPNGSHYATMARAGVSFCLFWGVLRTVQNAIDEIGALEAACPGAVHALEGPNEIKRDFAYGGQVGIAAAQQFMTDMRATARRSGALRDKPLVNYTSFVPAAGDCDFANQHPYPKAGSQPGVLLRRRRDDYVGPQGVMPGKPMVFTEFGYHTLVGKPVRPGHWQGVDERLQAILILNALFDATEIGITRTYIYQLFDAARDPPSGPSQEAHFGLFRLDGTPKPAAEALRRLHALLADDGPHARGFEPGAPPAQVSADASVRSLTLCKASGVALVALWNEAPVWDPVTSAPLAFAPTTAEIRLRRPRRARVADPTSGQADTDHGLVDRLSLRVGAAPLLLRLE